MIRSVMDAPVANSAAVIDSIGGDLHLVLGERADEHEAPQQSSIKEKVQHAHLDKLRQRKGAASA